MNSNDLKKIKKKGILSVANANKVLATKIQQTSQKVIFQMSTSLFYENQRPICAYFIHKGSVKLKKKNQTQFILKQGSLFAFKEYSEKSFVNYEAEVTEHSTLYLITKEDLHKFKCYLGPESDVSKLILIKYRLEK